MCVLGVLKKGIRNKNLLPRYISDSGLLLIECGGALPGGRGGGTDLLTEIGAKKNEANELGSCKKDSYGNKSIIDKKANK